jgi:hypothetical protein
VFKIDAIDEGATEEQRGGVMNDQKELTKIVREASLEMMRNFGPRVIKNSTLCVDREAEKMMQAQHRTDYDFLK